MDYNHIFGFSFLHPVLDCVLVKITVGWVGAAIDLITYGLYAHCFGFTPPCPR